jgi:UDPglucose 6-dehydrogenase
MGVRDAEMTKYAANAMLATKISFINEIASLCDELGVDVEKVRQGIGSDERIGFHFIYPGCGYGGSCFPKDVKALIKTADEHAFDTILLKSVERRNHTQKQVLPNKLLARLGEDLTGKIIAVWGLAFKPGTDDMRDASSKIFLTEVINRGAIVKAYDPEAMSVAKEELPQAWFEQGKLILVDRQEKVLHDADVFALITEWKQFRNPDFSKFKSLMRGRLILDGRNQYDPILVKSFGFDYVGIGRANEHGINE